MKVKVWIIESMGKRAKLCLSENKEKPEILAGPQVIQDKKLLAKALRYASRESRKYKMANNKYKR